MSATMADRYRELTEALANDPWVENSVRVACANLLKKWAKEDSQAAAKGKS